MGGVEGGVPGGTLRTLCLMVESGLTVTRRAHGAQGRSRAVSFMAKCGRTCGRGHGAPGSSSLTKGSLYLHSGPAGSTSFRRHSGAETEGPLKPESVFLWVLLLLLFLYF